MPSTVMVVRERKKYFSTLILSLQPEDALDAFNDETFGGGGLGEEWREDAHEELAGLKISLLRNRKYFIDPTFQL